MNRLFSVIVPVYNAEPYLRACVDSILAQTFTDFELFLVDDGSPDGCGAICDEYAARDGRVTVIHQPNQGVTAARKAALDRAAADYVCFVDADDSVKPQWLQTVRAYIHDNGCPDMAAFGFVQDMYDGKGPQDHPPQPAPGYYDKARLAREIYPYMLWDRRRPFLSQLFRGYLCTNVFRRQLLLDHFQQDRRITQYEDTAMLYSCFYAADSLYVCPDLLYIYHLRPGSAVKRRDETYLLNLRLVLDYMTSHLGREAPETLPQIHAYVLFRIFNLPPFLMQHGYSLRQTIRLFRAGMRQSGLAREIRGTGLPFLQRAFILLLKLRLYAAAVLVIKLRKHLSVPVS